MRFNQLEDWLSWQESLNPKSIDLGLERVAEVWRRLTPPDLSSSIVISIAGTNGKGSTVALFEAVLAAAGYSTGSYTSPHLLRYNERIRLNRQPLSDVRIMEAFVAIDQARGDLPLTYFEFGTLAAVYLFAAEKPDVVLLEVGLGGRLDAVNIIDADLSLITSIALDHQDWLGSDLETIGREKAGIFRRGRPAVFSGRKMPHSVMEYARALGSPLYQNGRDFQGLLKEGGATWNWQAGNRMIPGLPLPALPGAHQLQNAAGVIMALSLLERKLPLKPEALGLGLQTVTLPGRQQILELHGVQWLLDVSHNPHAVARLAEYLDAHPVPGRTRAVLGMLRDKDVERVAGLMRDQVQDWHLAGIDDPRGLNAAELGQRLAVAGIKGRLHKGVTDAMQEVAGSAMEGDRVVVFGSFHTVTDALAFLHSKSHH
ncbi:bifunctional tetrahydrofolate synthase/dihydrofolate synthase [Thiolapillus brandeum]|uniref:Dihydrofolate synthase/folylpolyglutamate synthase n=1 Tax=Thiolapillus brandeum TaxID=1076588 RepID=A0A7U6GIH5_9GAMM|nr:bifunctional tetrahydrofolate synthase/dihydrofolate synthase [Thiolapillus brandeum]BAO44218.1 dihydrofolate synthase / folylpolyglutamate synthase [Thiolapillus brandeum]